MKKIIALICGVALICPVLVACSYFSPKATPTPTPTVAAATPTQAPMPTESPIENIEGGIIEEGDLMPSVSPSVSPGASSGSTDVSNPAAKSVKDAAEKQSEVEKCAVVVTKDKQILVALKTKDNKSLSKTAKDAIMAAADDGYKLKITTDAAHYTEVSTMETTANGLEIAGDKIEKMWDKIK